jgi:hypothetical protein
MRVLVAAALLLSQPDVPTNDRVHGIVLRQDGRVADGARVDLQCGNWRVEQTAEVDGTFVFARVPAVACTLVVHAAEDSSAGVTVEVPATRDHRLSVILPAGLMHGTGPARDRLQIDLSHDETDRRRTPRTRTTGVGSWSSGRDPLSPTARPDQWSAGVTVERPGPWGTRLTGAVSARRLSGPTTLLSDITGTASPGTGMWSTLFDPSRTLTWDARLGVEKHWSPGGTDLTIFGDAYRSFQGGVADDGLMPLPATATKGLRSGTAGRVGVKLGF